MIAAVLLFCSSILGAAVWARKTRPINDLSIISVNDGRVIMTIKVRGKINRVYGGGWHWEDENGVNHKLIPGSDQALHFVYSAREQ